MFNALSPPQNQLYVRLLSERAFTFDRGGYYVKTTRHLAHFRPDTWRISNQTLGMFLTRHLAKKLRRRFCKCFSNKPPRQQQARRF